MFGVADLPGGVENRSGGRAGGSTDDGRIGLTRRPRGTKLKVHFIPSYTRCSDFLFFRSNKGAIGFHIV
jgi:hypothetical protein